MRKSFAILMIAISAAMFFQSCKKDSDISELTETKVEFTFTANGLKSSMLEDLTHVVVTIEDASGNIVKDNEKIEIYNMNRNYISKPLSLLTGNYKLTGFFVLNSANNVVYAAPIEGSDKAYLVNEPLPINFDAVKDVVTKVNPEVLSTTESHPQDFGYASFGFNIAETFDFLVGAFIYNELSANFELTTAQIAIYSGETLIYSGDLQANTDITPDNYDPLGITNKITLPETYESFTVNVSKSGYISYSETFTKEELKLYYRNEDNGPLIAILNELDLIAGLVAHYPLNGNVNDFSGNDYHGLDFGASGYITGNFDLARTFANDPTVGVNATDYMTIPNVISSEEFTISLWANFQYNGNHQMLIYLSEDRDWTRANFFLNLDLYMKLTVFVNGLDLRTSDYSHQALLNGSFNDSYINSAPLEMNHYYNITCTFKESVVTLFVNGVEYAQYLNVNTVVGNPSADIVLGVCTYPTPGVMYYPVVGQMDELKFYNRALTEDEIQQLAN